MNEENKAGVELEPEKAEPAADKKQTKQKKSKYSGAYWYLQQPDEDLTRQSFIRALLTVIAFMLQLVALLLLPATVTDYLLNNAPSYAYTYVFTVFIMLVTAIYTIVINFTRNKLIKRIPVERAPKKGFKYFAYIPEELLVFVLLIIFGMNVSFVAIVFDALGLVGMFVTLVSLGMQIWSRTIAVKILRTAERIPAAE
ncbi:MAG: hypothetical protein J1F39_01470 [Clostridiales bacterium]|nr:hypothetical protein [Clostridiales bacterium]